MTDHALVAIRWAQSGYGWRCSCGAEDADRTLAASELDSKGYHACHAEAAEQEARRNDSAAHNPSLTGPTASDTWGWACSCRKRGSRYQTPAEAMAAHHAHAASALNQKEHPCPRTS